MPINAYYRGHGDEVMANMQKEYGSQDKGKRVFYALANKLGAKPSMTGNVFATGDPNDMPPPPLPMPRSQYDMPPQAMQGAVPAGMPQMPQQARASAEPMPAMPPSGGPPPPPPPASPAPAPPTTVLNTGADSSMPIAPPPTPNPVPKPVPGEGSGEVLHETHGAPETFQIGPAAKREAELGKRYSDMLDKKTPAWKEALGIALNMMGAPQIGRKLTGDDQRHKALQETLNMGAIAKGEREQEAARSGSELRGEQIQTNKAWRDESNAARLAAIKPATTPKERYQQAIDIGASEETARQFALNPVGVKPSVTKPLTGDSLKVDLLKQQHMAKAQAAGEDITEEEAHNRALGDFAKHYTTGVEQARPEEYVKDPDSKTGYSRILRSSKTGEQMKVVRDVEVPSQFMDQVNSSNSFRFETVDGKLVKIPVTTTSQTQRVPRGGPAPVAQPTPAKTQAGPKVTALPTGSTAPGPIAPGPKSNLPPGSVVLGEGAADHRRGQEMQELSPAGEQQMKEVDVVANQFDNLLNKLEPHKSNNNPLTLMGPLLKYKAGMKTPEGELGSEISSLSLASIQGMMPFASKSRNYQFIKDIGQHLPVMNPSLMHPGGDSPAQIYDKLLKARLNFSRMRAAITKYETKHATPNAPPPPLPDNEAQVYFRAAGGDPAKATQMATADGWLVQ